jgi:putative oxidoreductase
MTITHALARSLIAPVFIGGGVDAIVHPDEQSAAAEKITKQLSEIGLPDDPKRLVRLNASVQLVAGSLLVLGRLPRLSSAALAASLVPTTLAGHRFWEEPDAKIKAVQRVQLMKNLAMLGGLLLAATDRGGAPSLTWRARRTANRTAASLGSMSASVSERLSSEPKLGERASSLGHRAAKAAGPLMERATELAGTVGEAVGDRASAVAKSLHALA